MVWAGLSWYSILLVPLLPSWPKDCKGVREQVGLTISYTKLLCTSNLKCSWI
jgi:hypothetical protein